MVALSYAGPRSDAFVSLAHHPDGGVELRVMYPKAARVERLTFPILIAVIILTLIVAMRMRSEALFPVFGAIVVLALPAMYFVRQELVDRRSMHRWVARRDGLTVERVSPAGYRRRQFVARRHISDVTIDGGSGSGTRKHLTIQPLGMFGNPSLVIEDLEKFNFYEVAAALRTGLELDQTAGFQPSPPPGQL
jgi:hypothetical protein